jgi:hypothetical protein
VTYDTYMENDLYTYTFCREDWELIMGALRGCSLENLEQARKVGLDSTYGAVLADRAAYMQALASDIDFKLPE